MIVVTKVNVSSLCTYYLCTSVNDTSKSSVNGAKEETHTVVSKTDGVDHTT